MKLIIESNGTMRGTKLEFEMTADEVPKMIERYQRSRIRRLKRRTPPDVIIPSDIPEDVQEVARNAGLIGPWVPPGY